MVPHDLMVPPRDADAYVAEAWHELGCERYRAMAPRVLLRTWRIAEKIGRIWLPDSVRTFYKGLPHGKLVRATVLAGPRGSGLQPGDAVCFPQTFFIRLHKLMDDTLVGAVLTKYLHGRIVLTEEDFRALDALDALDAREEVARAA